MIDLWCQYQKEKYDLDCLKAYSSKGEVVGIIFYKHFISDNSLYIHTLYVMPTHRNKKIAQKLEKELLNKIKPRVVSADIDKESQGWEYVLERFKEKGYKVLETSYNKVLICKYLDT